MSLILPEKKLPLPDQNCFFFHFTPPRASFFPRLFFRPHVVLPPAPSLMVFLSNLYFTSLASSLHSHCHDVSCERMQPGTLRIIQSRIYPAAEESRPIRTPAPAVKHAARIGWHAGILCDPVLPSDLPEVRWFEEMAAGEKEP